MNSCNARLDQPVIEIGSQWLAVNQEDGETLISSISDSGTAIVTSESWWHYKFSSRRHVSVMFVNIPKNGKSDYRIAVSGLPFSKYGGFTVEGIGTTVATGQFLGIMMWVNSRPIQYYYGFIHLDQSRPLLDLRYQTTDGFISFSFLRQGTRANPDLAGYMLFLNERNSVCIHPLTKDIVIMEKF